MAGLATVRRRFRGLSGEIGGRARGDGGPLDLAHFDGPVARDQAGQAGEHRREEEKKFQKPIPGRALTCERRAAGT